MNHKTAGTIRYGMNIILRAELGMWYGTLQDFNKTLVPRSRYGSWVVLPFFHSDDPGAVIIVPVPASYIVGGFSDVLQERIDGTIVRTIVGIGRYNGWWEYMRRWSERKQR